MRGTSAPRSAGCTRSWRQPRRTARRPAAASPAGSSSSPDPRTARPRLTASVAGLEAVRLSGDESGAGNIHAAWRMAVAMRAAEAYAGNRNLTALAVAGSVGAGLADRFSDLELDCYWVRPPTVTDRVAPVHALGGELTALWDYDEDEKEWSEEYRVGELDITVSNFLASAVEQFLDDV